MKKNIFNKILPLFIMMAVYIFSSCSNDDDKTFIAGDVTALKKDLAISYDTLALAKSENYEQQDITEFKNKLDLISSVVEKGNVSEQEVINLTVHVDEALSRFLRSKMYGIPEEALIAGWNFDESANSLVGDGERKLIADLKAGPSQIFGTSAGFPKFVDEGINGKAIYLNNGAHLAINEFEPSDFLGKQLAIALWVKPDVIKGGNYIASLNYWNNWKFQIQEQGKTFFTLKTVSGISDSDNEKDLSVPKQTWTHIVLVLDLENPTSALAFYVNGILTKAWKTEQKPSITGAQAPLYQSSLGTKLPLMIGTATIYDEAKAAWDWGGWDNPSSWDYFQGAMDEFKFYNAAITAGQVKWLYNKEAALLQ